MTKTKPSEDTSWQGKCYSNTIKFMIKYDDKDYYICHGIVKGQGKINGNYICHAWIEDDDNCYDYDSLTNNICRIPKKLYYLIGDIDLVQVRKYNKMEMFENIQRTEHAGPWDQELIYHAINEEGSVYELPK